MIRVSYQDNRIVISCHDGPYLYIHYAGHIKFISLVGTPDSRFKMIRYEGPAANCKEEYAFRCLESCQKPVKGSVACGEEGELQIIYPKCVLRYCTIDTGRVKSEEKAVPCGSRRMLRCKKGFLPEESQDFRCSESGWEPPLTCFHINEVRVDFILN